MNLKKKLGRILARSSDRRRMELTKRAAIKEVVFEAPPLTDDLIDAIKLISPWYNLKLDEESRKFWELDQNISCWAEFDALSQTLKSFPRPARVLEIGPGLGRSVVFFSRKLDWNDTEYHLFEGNGDKTKYTIAGPRFEDSFCGNLALLARVLEFNGIKNFKIFDAEKLGFKLNNLRETYDVVYSFYSVGFHWSLEHFLDEILGLMHERSIAFFTVPNNFVPFDQLGKLHYRVAKTIRLANEPVEILMLSKSNIFDVKT